MRAAVGSVDCEGEAVALAYTAVVGGYQLRVVLLAGGPGGFDAVAGVLDANPYLGLWPGPDPAAVLKPYRGFTAAVSVRPGSGLRLIDGGASWRLRRRSTPWALRLELEGRGGRAVYTRVLSKSVPRVATGYASERGPRRANEDSLAVASLAVCRGGSKTTVHLVLVADGAGGMLYGRQASAIAVLEALAGLVDVVLDGGGVGEGLVHGFRRADSRLVELLGRGRAASTLTAYAVSADAGGATAYYAWSGDTALIAVSNGSATRLTRLHRVEVSGRSVLSNYIGSGAARPEAGSLSLASGALAALTDGVHDYVGLDEVAGLVESSRTPSEAARRIVELALRRGSRDNATAVVTFVRAGSEA